MKKKIEEKIDESDSVKKNGCKGCSKYNPREYCIGNIDECNYLLERDFFAGRVTEKEYKKLKLEVFDPMKND